ncbi:class I adenylate-forming enzyme family protein [Pseudonocardia dioxanivorans]|uniref:class I adenylate-forming enzyme family protein n=1 Tax=Pseudonocardia dioxanivorans TaxID=240495 RepID=UPI000CD05410|nr:class I adenylate-forming enzyme family protein [Pseudonocardia dioxanivorans]
MTARHSAAPFDDLDELTLPAMLHLLAAERGAEEAVVAPDGRVTWSELLERSRATATRYRALGLEPGDRIGVLLPNSVSWLVATFGAHLAGLVVVPVNTFYRATEYAHLIRTAGLRLLVAREVLFGRSVLEDLDSAGFPGRVGARADGQTYQGMLDWPAGDPLPPGTEEPAGFSGATVSSEDIALVLFTSGSTAKPKAVPLRHGNLLRNGHAIGRRQHLVPGDRLWIASPFFFGYGCGNALPTALTHGVTLCMQERIDGEANLEFIERERCTVYYGLSPATHALLAAPSFGSRDISSLRTGTTGQTAEDKRLAVERLGITEVCSVYGLTESYGHSTMTEAGDPLEVVMHTVGRVLPTQELRIVDEHGAPCPIDTPGEVELRGCVLDGYLDPPEANSSSFRDGWFRTGDLAFLDGDARMHFVGRFKEMVKVKGVNIAPAEVEEVLATHPDVVQVHVVGADDGAGGEHLVAFLVLTGALAAEALTAHVRTRAASYKVPARFVVLDAEEVPLTPTGKVSRLKLRERAEKAP